MKKSKKLLILLAAGLLTAAAMQVSAEDVSPGTETEITQQAEKNVTTVFSFMINEDSTTVTITEYNGTETDVVIPESINGMEVTGIATSAFGGNTEITSVTMPDTVLNINASAFKGCLNLENIKLSKNLLTMGEYVFHNCDALVTIELPEKISTIPTGAFRDCDALEKITIPSSVTSIGEKAFDYCVGLTTVTIEEGVENIGGNAFRYCKILEKVTLPSSVVSIGIDSFYSCPKLKTAGCIGGGYNIEFGWTKMIPANAFRGLTSLSAVDIPETVETIGNYAFYGCSGIDNIVIPASVAKIGSSTFSGCSGLVTAGPLSGDENGIKYNYQYEWTDRIAEGAFAGIKSLKTVVLPEEITEIPARAFSGCVSLTEVKVPETVVTIGNSAFSNCDAVTKFILPTSVTSLGDSVFSNCDMLSEVILPASLIAMGDGAFYNCDSIIEIEIPANVTVIEDETFLGCSSLERITLPKALTKIGREAFAECTSLTRVDIPLGVHTVEKFAFKSCESLETAYFYGDVPRNWGRSVFEDVEIDFTIYYPATNSSGWETPEWEDPLGYEYTASPFVITDCDHSYTKITFEPTCKTAGYEKFACYNCGDSYITENSEAPALGHTYEIVEVVQATCTTSGHAVYKCIRCTDSYKGDHVSKFGHSYAKYFTVEATCEKGGYTIFKCSRCDSLYNRNYVDPIGHSWSDWKIIKAPTTTETGLRERRCGNCKMKEQIVLHTLLSSHIYAAEVVQPTCTEEGYTIYTCSSCSYSYIGDFIEPFGHDWDEKYSGSATCTEGEHTSRYCRYCELEEIISSTPALGHEFIVISTVEASCDKAGYDNLECTRCKELTVGNIVTVPHTPTEWIVDELPTETSEGSMHMDCAVCFNTYDRRPVPRMLLKDDSGYIIEEGLLKNVAQKTSASDIVDAFAVDVGEVKIYAADGTELSSVSYVGTGCEVCLAQDDVVFARMTVIITGDISGDGVIDSVDSDILTYYYAGWPGYAEKIAHSAAADINVDGAHTRADGMMLARILKGWTIE